MVKAIWVEDIQDPVKRTSALELALRQNGYKITRTAFADLLRKNGAERLLDYFENHRIVVGPVPNGNGGLAYGIMRLDDKYAFYITNLKLKPEGFPEFRIIIENVEEFDSWLVGFIQMAKSQIITMIDSQKAGI